MGCEDTKNIIFLGLMMFVLFIVIVYATPADKDVSCSDCPKIETSTQTPPRPLIINMQINVDDLEDKKNLENFMDIIKNEQFKSTIFFTKSFALQNQETVKTAYERGFEIGLLEERESDITSLVPEEQKTEMENTVKELKNVFGKEIKFKIFKPRNLFLEYSETSELLSILKEMGFTSIVAHFNVDDSFKCSYCREYQRIVYPYPTEYGIVAIPYIQSSSEPFSEQLDYISDVQEKIKTISINPSNVEINEFSDFLKNLKENNAETLLIREMEDNAKEYEQTLRFGGGYFSGFYLSAPEKSDPGQRIQMTVNYYTTVYCPNYYFRIYGKYASDASWNLLYSTSFYVPIGWHSFSFSTTIPPFKEKNYIIKAVGRACETVCWPSLNSYEVLDLKTIKVKDPTIYKYRGIELKPGDLVYTLDTDSKDIIPGDPNHLGIYVGNGKVVHSNPKNGVHEVSIKNFGDKYWYGATSVLAFRGLPANVETNIRNSIVNYARSQIGKNYNFNFLNPEREDKFYCSQLGYKAYQHAGYQLNTWRWGSAVAPYEIYYFTSDALGATTYTIDPPPKDFGEPHHPIIKIIYPDTSVVEKKVIDPTVNEAVFGVTWPPTGSVLDLKIYRPDGTPVNMSDPDIIHEENTSFGYEHYIVQQPEPGNWTMNITAISVPTEGENYSTIIYLSANLTLSTFFDENWADLYNELKINANLSKNDIPQTGADVSADVFLPNGTVFNIMLFDDGSHGDITSDDGIYTNIIETNSGEGLYGAIVKAKGYVSGNEFERESYASLYAFLKTTAFTGTYSDYGLESNNDTKFDYLVVLAGVNVTDAGNFTVEGMLVANNGTEIDRTDNYSELHNGVQNVMLKFNGRAIYESKINGSHRLDIGIYDRDGVTVNYKENAYITHSYNYSQFQASRALKGLVKKQGGLPVENAYVIAIGEWDFDYDYTNVNGSYELSGLYDGYHNISVIPPTGLNLLDNYTRINITQTPNRNFTLNQGSIVSGTIKNHLGSPVSNATVIMEGNYSSYSTSTYGNGTYVINSIESGFYTFRVVPTIFDNLKSNSTNFTLGAAQSKSINMTLVQAGSIAGYVMNVNETPIENALIYIEGFETPHYLTAADGSYAIGELNAGNYTVSLLVESWETSKQTLVVLGQTSYVNFTVPYEECTSTPADGCVVTTTTTFSSGGYALPNGIRVMGDNIKLKCNSTILNGQDAHHTGITISDSKNIEIEGCTIRRYDKGISITSSSNVTIKENIIKQQEYGIAAEDVTNSTINNNLITYTLLPDKGIGIYLLDTSNILVQNNEIKQTQHGIQIAGDKSKSFNNTLLYNNLSNIYWVGLYIWADSHNNNIFKNQIIRSAVGSSDVGIWIAVSNNNTFKWNVIKRNRWNVYLPDANYTEFQYNIISDGGDGIYSEINYSGHSTIIKNNTIKNHTYYDFVNAGKANINAEHNWWGTTDYSTISSHIVDYYDYSLYGIVDFYPYLTSEPVTECMDSDRDGYGNPANMMCLFNGGDNCPNVSNPDQTDQDNDTIGNACDNCPTIYNTNQTDNDLDNHGSVCDCDDNNSSIVPNACINGGTGAPPPTYCNATGGIEFRCQQCGGCTCPNPHNSATCFKCGSWGGCYRYKEPKPTQVVYEIPPGEF